MNGERKRERERERERKIIKAQDSACGKQ